MLLIVSHSDKSDPWNKKNQVQVVHAAISSGSFYFGQFWLLQPFLVSELWTYHHWSCQQWMLTPNQVRWLWECFFFGMGNLIVALEQLHQNWDSSGSFSLLSSYLQSWGTHSSISSCHNKMRIRAHLLTELKTQLEWGYQFKLLMLSLHKWACCTKVKKIV